MERPSQMLPETPHRPERDVPAVYLVNAALLDNGLGLSGGWVRLDQSVPDVAARIGEIVGYGGDHRNYVVIDQTGLGPIMWDEDDIVGLLAFAARSGCEQR